MEEGNSKKKKGRPRLVIDLEQVADMAEEGCTQEEISKDMGFSRSLFVTRKDVKAAFESGFVGMKMNLRRWQLQSAKNGNVQMQIWLGKQYLGQKDIMDEGAKRDEVPRVVDDIRACCSNG